MDHNQACPTPPAFKVTDEAGLSLADQLKTFSKSQLKHQRTNITYQSGKKITVDGDTVVEEGTSQAGYVIDTKPDQLCYKVLPGLFIGSQDCVTDAQQLQQLGITHVLNLVPDLQPLFPELFEYLTVPLLDVDETDLLGVLPQCLEWIRLGRAAGGVVVHCNAGVSRSAAVTTAAVMVSEGWSVSQSLTHLKAVRAAVQPNKGFVRQLHLFAHSLHQHTHTSVQ